MADDIVTRSAPAIISRADAKAAGLKSYFDGEPCCHGHFCGRYTASTACLECARITRKAHYDKRSADAAYVAKNRARAADWYARNPERGRARSLHDHFANHDERLAYKKAYAAKRPDVHAKAARKWRDANKAAISERDAKWKRENADRVREYSRNRRATIKRAEGVHTEADVRRIYEAQRGCCAACRHDAGNNFHVDHIQPLSKGGSNWPRNLQILCAPCNSSKQDRDPVEFMQSLGMLI